LIDVTPAPILSRFERADDGMLGVVKVLGRVPARRGIATADMAAREAKAQVHPSLPGLEALLATVSMWTDVFDLV
jgi:hypothetical protein